MTLSSVIPLSVRKFLGGWWHTRSIRSKKRQLLASLEGSGTVCNVCGWEGRAFADDIWHPGTVCPECGSQVRHRLLTAAFDHLPDFRFDKTIEGKRVLHFAPERQLRARVASASIRYVSADFDRGDVDLRLDISRMPEISDGEFDVLLCCDVLEHVPDEAGAYREIRRVLAPDGVAILTVPQRDSPAVTEENLSITDPEERVRLFGQRDHVRMFGQDFSERVVRAGFFVQTVESGDFDPEVCRRHVLEPPVAGRHALATNHRRIYFCRPHASA